MSEVVMLQVEKSKIYLVYHGMRHVTHADIKHLECWLQSHTRYFKTYGGGFQNEISIMPCGDSWVIAYQSPFDNACATTIHTPRESKAVLGDEDPWGITCIALALLVSEYYDCYGLSRKVKAPLRIADQRRLLTASEEVSILLDTLKSKKYP